MIWSFDQKSQIVIEELKRKVPRISNLKAGMQLRSKLTCGLPQIRSLERMDDKRYVVRFYMPTPHLQPAIAREYLR